MAGGTAFILFIVAFAFRYARLLVGIFANLFYKPYIIHAKPRYVTSDVTVVIPTTFKKPAELLQCLKNIVNCYPAKIFIVTSSANVPAVYELCYLSEFRNAQVLGVEKLNKRHQLLVALQHVNTDIVVFADDDVFWPSQCLDHLLAIFENPNVGAGGPLQRTHRMSRPNFWNFLAIAYLERRCWNNITSQAIDGSISTLSGRTAAYRTRILKNEEFFQYFTNDSWLGRRLNTDDDKCLTRFVYSQGWEIALQRSTVIETTMECNIGYLKQCKRWARAHWRGNFTVMTNETYWCSPKYLWGLYVIYLGQFQTPALLIDGVLLALLSLSVDGWPFVLKQDALVALACWILFSKIVKLVPHFCRYPKDLIFIPVSVAFSYLHGVINIYSLCTLHVTAWGSQQLDQLEKARVRYGDALQDSSSSANEEGHCQAAPGEEAESEEIFRARPLVS